MEVVRVRTEENRIRYYLADDDGLPVEPVLRFLKFKDNTGYARNTLRMYCQHLKQYFTYLGERRKEFADVTIDDLAGFIAWLQNPYIHQKVVPLLHKPTRKPHTVNKTVDTVVAFYDYLTRHGEYEGKLPEALVKFIRNPGRNYRGFLYGIAETKAVKSHVLKLRVPHMGLRTIKREDAVELLRACRNLRDYFLLYLLFETGMRIGEALSLWLEDFDSSGNAILLKDRGELENQAEIKTVSSPRRLDITQELMDLFTEYVCMFHTEGVRTNHVFIKLRGDNDGKAMDYTDVDNLFRTLRKKTDITVTPHMFRHTSLSLLYSAGWEPELLRVRAGHKNIYTTNMQLVRFLKNMGICTEKSGCKTYKNHLWFKNGLTAFITAYYDEREETEKDVWIAVNIPGARISAAEKSGTRRSLNFHDVPGHYREVTKRFLRSLVTRRSWSYCCEMLMYIRYFFGVFYEHGYVDGFLKVLTREDVEKYLLWIADD